MFPIFLPSSEYTIALASSEGGGGDRGGAGVFLPQEGKDFVSQVVCVLKEERAPEMLQGRRHMTSHVCIPATYQSGVSIFVRSDNPCLQELLNAPELPLLDE
ncbi:hypothetical protein Anas_08186 [Armadillidium nasatum]|uniref:Uncharacterized protein n=1 Tax=Armadillidium nasatum TaxID=96803 RepID=A0A5N5SJ25_9CRUS|nr:hypothetical protein Anas_08186 [Armadillidium nasatum]